MPQDILERRTYTVEEFAKLAGLGRSLTYSLARANRLPVPVVRVGVRILIPKVAADRVLNGDAPVQPVPAKDGQGQAQAQAER